MTKDKPNLKILIIGPSWVGDMVMAQSLFMVLKKRNPECQIDVLAPAWSLPLLERMPEVTGAIAMPVGHGSLQLKVRWKLARQLAKSGYHQAILLPNSLKSALIPWFARIKKRTGWKGEARYILLNDLRKLDKEKYPLMVERFVALAVAADNKMPPCPNPKLNIDSKNIPELLTKFSLNLDRPVLVLCPGAEFGPAKRWPERHYAAVAAQMIEAGWQVWLMGSAKDNPVAKDICATLTDQQRSFTHIMAGNTALSEAVDLMSQAAAVVSNDSGLMHIAAALGRPLVSVYGSTSPKFTPPLADQVKVVSIPVDCGPCFQRECPLGHMKCLNDLPPQQVIDALTALSVG